MAFTKAFLVNRGEHLAAKLIATKEALHREGLLCAARTYKIKILIPQIIAAQKRLADGIYGLCLDCCCEIDEERLLKHPHVARCVPCQKEKEGG